LETDPATRWVRTHQERVFWYLRYLRCPRDLAEDLLQEALAIGLQRPFVLGMAEPEANRWLRTTARNLYFMHLRRQRRVPEVEDPEVLEQVWQEALEEPAGDQRDPRSALTECLQHLDGRGREALDLRYRDGMGRDEIGAQLGMSAHGVKSLLRRLRASLRACMERRMK